MGFGPFTGLYTKIWTLNQKFVLTSDQPQNTKVRWLCGESQTACTIFGVIQATLPRVHLSNLFQNNFSLPQQVSRRAVFRFETEVSRRRPLTTKVWSAKSQANFVEARKKKLANSSGCFGRPWPTCISRVVLRRAQRRSRPKLCSDSTERAGTMRRTRTGPSRSSCAIARSSGGELPGRDRTRGATTDVGNGGEAVDIGLQTQSFWRAMPKTRLPKKPDKGVLDAYSPGTLIHYTNTGSANATTLQTWTW